MLVVVFGAGASYDSVDRANLRPGLNEWQLQRQPPLADDLFGNRAVFGDTVGRYGVAAALMSDVRRAVGRGVPVETALELHNERSMSSPRLRQQLAAVRFYLQDMLTECSLWPQAGNGLTNYADLVDAIEEWRVTTGESVTYVTFNYDTILEQACTQQLGWEFRDIGSYLGWRGTSLIKVHGSVTWAHPVAGPGPDRGDRDWRKNEMIRLVDQLEFSRDDFALVANAEPTTGDGRWAFPALAIPLASKSAFECPQAHVAEVRLSLAKATRLLLIGWRAADEPFLRLMADALMPGCRVQVVAGSDAAPIVDRLTNARIPIGETHVETGGFTRFVAGKEWSWLFS